jgi:ubiquinone/menaquinone biosynthesis C-methylase UbiE
MKLNWVERGVVNNPLRVLEQRFQIRYFKKVMPLKTGAVVLEIGCGRGAGAKLIYKHFNPALLAPQDLDFTMVQKARRYLSKDASGRMFLSAADATRIPFKDRSFDAVFGFGFLHHVPNWQKALVEVARVLKPGGIYYMEELYPAVYANFITRRLLVHPETNRFKSVDLHQELARTGMPLQTALECRFTGLLGVAVKKSSQTGMTAHSS